MSNFSLLNLMPNSPLICFEGLLKEFEELNRMKIEYMIAKALTQQVRFEFGSEKKGLVRACHTSATQITYINMCDVFLIIQYYAS